VSQHTVGHALAIVAAQLHGVFFSSHQARGGGRAAGEGVSQRSSHQMLHSGSRPTQQYDGCWQRCIAGVQLPGCLQGHSVILLAFGGRMGWVQPNRSLASLADHLQTARLM
jgi:hypothetical protein